MMRSKKWLSGLLVFAMLFLLTPAAFAADDTQKAVTRGEVCSMLLQAADAYNPKVQKSDILKGDADGQLHEDRGVTRAEALVMLKRAFGTLPKPVGANARVAIPASQFTDIPAWAQSELQNVFDAGIVAGTGATTFSPNDPVTAAQMDLFIRRTWALLGTNEKDDLYATVNKAFLDQSVIKPGRQVSGTMYDLMDQSAADVQAIITQVAGAKQTYAKDSKEQKISDLYNNIMNKEAREKAGIDPIRPYLEAIDKAASLNDLMAVQQTVSNDTTSSLFLGFSLVADAKDSNKSILYFGGPSATLTKEVYEANSGAQKDAYLKYLTTVGKLGGLSDEEAARDAELYWNMERDLSKAALAPQEMGDIAKFYNIHNMQQLKAIFPKVDLDAVLLQSGLKIDEKIMVADVGQLKAFATYMNDEHLDTLKAVARMGVLLGHGGSLNRAFEDASNTFSQEFYGTEGVRTDEEVAAQIVQSLLPEYLGKLYVDKHFSAKAKDDVTAMVKDFIAIYRERIQALDWMSDATKQKALRKLDTMKIKIGYPDKWDSYADNASIKSVLDGGSLFQNICELNKAYRAELVSQQGKPTDKTEWGMNAFTVNAQYNAMTNDITFPAGILQAPMYDIDAPREQNLGAIGYVIAHEITHAFDNNGAKFDENGNANDWWTAEDYAAFQKLCAEVVAYYDGQEAAPGIACNGTLTLSENIADLGAAACVTQAAQKLASPDMKVLYQSMAKTWSSTMSREMMTYMAQADVHALDKLRGNRVVQSCDAFYTAFEIKPEDGMYLAPDARVKIW